MGLKDIFTVQKTVETEQKNRQENSDEAKITVLDLSNYTAKGTRDAGKVGGSHIALHGCLHATYVQLSNFIKQNEKIQNERRNKTQQEISLLEAKNLDFDNRIKHEDAKLKHEENKIEDCKDKINHIRANPRSASGDPMAKMNFGIGVFIIAFLTIYLFVFYSSAAYSAFFRNFSDSATISVASAIFFAQTVVEAYKAGLWELIFVLAIPFVFIGLGFLIHQFSEEKGISKHLKILGLILITFIFDSILAYKIVFEIEFITTGRQIPFREMIFELNFWAIIFAGFVVYIIWGLVFGFIMKNYERMDSVRVAINIEEQKKRECETECKNINEKILNLQTQKTNNQGEIDKLYIRINGYIVYFDDVAEGINNYFTGWVGFMKSAHISQSDVDICRNIKDTFFHDLRKAEFISKNSETEEKSNTLIN